MAVNVRIPTPLQTFTKAPQVQVSAATVKEAIDSLGQEYPGFKDRLCDGEKLRRHILIYVNDEDIRFLEGDSTVLKDGDEVSIVPAIAGG